MTATHFVQFTDGFGECLGIHGESVTITAKFQDADMIGWAMLVLIGTGRLEQAVRAQAQELGITDHILFAGLQSNVADWYQMMDLFVMPSRFEGLPVVGIEAQAAGLGCVFSDAVPAEVLLSSHAIQIPLSASNADWAAGLQRMLHQPCDRSAGAELIRQAGYDINIAAARLQQQYLQLGGQA